MQFGILLFLYFDYYAIEMLHLELLFIYLLINDRNGHEGQ